MSVSTVGLEETVNMLSPGCSFTGHIDTDIWESETLVCCLYKYGISIESWSLLSFLVHNCCCCCCFFFLTN